MADLKDAGAVAVSDDGRCVTQQRTSCAARSSTRATFDLPVIQHAEDHALTEGAQMHEGAVSTRLGLRGWPRVAEDVIVARDVLLAEYDGRAVPRRARVDDRRGAHPPRGEVARHRGHGRGDAAPPAAHRRRRSRLRHGVQGEPAAPRAGGRRGAARARSPTARSTASRPTTRRTRVLEKDCEFAEAAPGMIGLELCLPLLLGLVREGVLPLARLVDALTRAPARIVGLDAAAHPRGRARPTSSSSIPRRAGRVDAARLRTKSKNTPFSGARVQGHGRDDARERPRRLRRRMEARERRRQRDRAYLVLADGTVFEGAPVRRARRDDAARPSSRRR